MFWNVTRAAIACAAAGLFIAYAIPAVGRDDGPRITRAIDMTVDAPDDRIALNAGFAELHVDGENETNARPQARGTGTGATRPREAGSIVIHGTVTGFKAAVDGFSVNHQSTGGTTVIAFDEQRTFWTHGLVASFHVLVPADRLLSVKSGAGDVRVGHIERDTNVQLGSGSVMLRDIVGNVTVRDSSGDVLIENASGTVDAHSSSGSVVAHDVRSTLALGSSSGDVSATLQPAWNGASIALETSSGNVALALPPGFTARVDAHTNSGTVHVPAVLAAGVPSATPVRLRSSSGDITVR